jgi:hypothetical protein
MSKVKLQDSKFMDDYLSLILDDTYELSATSAYKVFDSIIYGMAKLLSSEKDKNKKVAAVLKNSENEILLSMIVEYNQDSEDEEVNNWLVSMSVNKDDITEDTSVMSQYDSQLQFAIAEAAAKRNHFRYLDSIALVSLSQSFGKTLNNWLDKNANEEEEMSIEDDLFTASVAVEGDDKIFAITPGANIKKVIAKSEPISVSNASTISMGEKAAMRLTLLPIDFDARRNSNGLITPIVSL